MLSRRIALRTLCLSLPTFALTSCGSLWAQYQAKRLDLRTQLASGKISQRTYDQRMAELDRWYENGGRTPTRRRSSSGSSASKSSTTKTENTGGETHSDYTPTSTADKPYPRSTDDIHDVGRREKSGLDEF